MSFILDALKKLEQKRNQQVPDLMTVHTHPVQKPQKRLPWLIVIVLALLINAAIMLAWLKPWQTDKQTVEEPSLPEQHANVTPQPAGEPDADRSASAAPASVPEKPAASSAAPEVAAQSSSESSPSSVKSASLTPENMNESRPALTEPSPDGKTATGESEPSGTRTFLPDEKELAALRGKIKDEIGTPAGVPTEPDEIRVPAEPDPAVSHQEIIEMSQLPDAIKRELPGIAIHAHIYSNIATSRVVNINGIILHEGEDISRGLALEEITETGVILTYKDHRFRIRAF